MIKWDVSPSIFDWGFFHLRYYSLMFIAGFTIGFQLMVKVFRDEKKPLDKSDAILTHIFLGTLIGARLGHVLFYSPGYYFSHPLDIFKVWEGGLASHGGGLGVIVALILFVRKNPEFNLMWLFDRISIVTIMTGALIRLGNLMNSEIVGRPTDVPWAFIFSRIDQLPRHPTPLYESFGYFLIFILLWSIWLKYKSKTPSGLLLGTSLLLTFIVRFVVEFFKENQEAFEATLPINMGQILSLPYIFIGAYLVFRALPNLPNKKKS